MTQITLNNRQNPVSLFFALLLGFIILLGSSCKREDPNLVTEQDAVDVMESAVSSQDEGLSTTASGAARLATEVAATCLSGDSSFTAAQSGTVRNYSFNTNWNWTVTCSQGVPQSFGLNASSSGTYSGPRIDYSGSSTAALTVGNLVSGDFIVNGTASQIANVSSQVRDGSSFGSETQISLSNVTVDRTSYEILGGTGTLTFAGTTDDGSYTFTGTIAFLGGGSATITVNGNSYTISI